MFALPVQIPRPVRFALFYGAFYLGFGAYLPYMPVWYETRGLSPEMIGAAAAASMAGRMIAAPLGAMLADRAPKKRWALLTYSLVSFFAFAAFIPATHPWAIIVLAGIAGGAFTGIMPIVDAFAIQESTRKKFAFGPPRAFGSATFILGNVGAGGLIGWLGGEAALAWTLIGAALAVLTALMLPEGRNRPQDRKPQADAQGGVVRAMVSNGLPLAFAASALIQGAHGFYYGFSAVAWRAEGVPSSAVGLLWATGVGAEIVFLTFSGRLLNRVSPAMMLSLGGAASILRWLALSVSPPLWLLFPFQLLHALTFSATYLGFLRYAADNSPQRFASMAQAINSAFSGGLILALAAYASGFAFKAFGAGGFAVMALPSGLGLIFALWLVQSSRTQT
ncbi:MFS transporter [Oceanicaulis sp. MMSF_3324]|uniref:MFS transporter n=1 Tax=Oceanicaulis sp. MMSF_3324 TaxID=3046702 RepID=UPI00273DD65F|nr:MFS transporter [Oceanicaulis sp. MMSF_3324]